MPVEITMPQLSDTMTEGTVVKWLKNEGDKIKSGDIIAEVETDKATMEMESFEAGTLAVRVVAEGDRVPVGSPIAVLATGKESADEVKKNYKPGKAAAPAPQAEAQPAEAAAPAEPTHRGDQYAPGSEGQHGAEAAGQHQPAATAVAAPPASQPSRISEPAADTGGNGAAGRIKISPLARRIAQENGIDFSQIEGSGPGGRIVQKDVLAFIESGGQTKAPAAAAPAPAKPAPAAAPAAELPQRVATGQTQTIELTKMRQTIATRLQQSKQQIPHFYETIDIDVEALVALRKTINQQLEKQNVRLSISDFINKAIAVALREHPALNAHFDAKNNRIIRYGDVHLGIAVAIPDGLIVPVLRSIDQMGLREIRQRSVDLVDRARAQRLKREELSGATFTVSTLGMYGIREFAAIINPPEVGILAVGAAEQRAVVRNGQIVARNMMTVTLSVDHRAVDGATAAEFLRTLKALLEEPGMMLV